MHVAPEGTNSNLKHQNCKPNEKYDFRARSQTVLDVLVKPCCGKLALESGRRNQAWEQESRTRSLGKGIKKDKSRRSRSQGKGIEEESSRKRNQGGKNMDESRRRNHGRDTRNEGSGKRN